MIDGHLLLADWFFLIAAILFVLYAVITYAAVTTAKWVATLPYLGAALVALGFWVL